MTIMTASIRVQSARYNTTDQYQPLAMLLGEAKRLLDEANWYAQQAEGHTCYEPEYHGCVYVYDLR